MKQNNGITMIQMIITVVMLILIASFSIYNSTNTLIETKIAKAYNEIMEVKKAVKGFILLNESNMVSFPGEKMLNLDSIPELAALSKPDQEYYYLNFKEDQEYLCDVLELRNIENDYIVNVKEIENIEIFSVDGVPIDNEKFYTDYQIIEKYNDIFAGN